MKGLKWTTASWLVWPQFSIYIWNLFYEIICSYSTETTPVSSCFHLRFSLFCAFTCPLINTLSSIIDRLVFISALWKGAHVAQVESSSNERYLNALSCHPSWRRKPAVFLKCTIWPGVGAALGKGVTSLSSCHQAGRGKLNLWKGQTYRLHLT